MTYIFNKPIYRHKNIGIRVTSEELFNLHKLCDSTELTISELVRTAVNDFAVRKQAIQVFQHFNGTRRSTEVH
jgi:hypothetical protein